jgi:hypothetical protein
LKDENTPGSTSDDKLLSSQSDSIQVPFTKIIDELETPAIPPLKMVEFVVQQKTRYFPSTLLFLVFQVFWLIDFLSLTFCNSSTVGLIGMQH